MMKSSHIGLHHPEFFLHWADFEFKVERKDKSLAVLATANDTPIMRGNLQIKEAKELIEKGQNMKLDILFSLNLSRKPPPSISGSTSAQDPTLFSNRMEIGLGPAKRVKEDKENIVDDKVNVSREDKANVLREDKSYVLREDKANVLREENPSIFHKDNSNRFNTDNNNNNTLNNLTGQSGNSNMSLTMTELNIKTPQIQLKSNIEEFGTFKMNAVNNPSNNNTGDIVTVVNDKPTTSTATGNSVLKSRQVRVNGKIYRVLQLIGRGGSSKVFRVIDGEGQIFALKRVNLKNLDEVTLSSYTNEISLLKSFSNNPHIIQLIDSEMNKEQACLYILMEYGEVDLGKMLKNRLEAGLIGEKSDENFLRFSFQQVKEKVGKIWLTDVNVYVYIQMLMAVNTVHEAKIVHCDLKPANFLLVQGTLKLIDFGISKAILNDTTNIVRENQVGTVNYMSPEALQETSISTHDHRGRLKIGRPSDIWSLGCILYEMTFGKPPFAQFTTLIQRLHKILDPGYEIEFPSNHPNQDLISVMKGCLLRPPKERLTLYNLFNNPFLKPVVLTRTDQVLISKNQLFNLLQKFAEAYPGIDPNLLTDRIFHQWKN